MQYDRGKWLQFVISVGSRGRCLMRLKSELKADIESSAPLQSVPKTS